MQIKTVDSRADWRDFHRVPRYIYRRDPLYIAPIQGDIENIFNPATNKTYQNGQARQWVLYDDRKKPIGRIAAFIDHQRNQERDYPVGGIGFFECVNDDEAAGLLFDMAEQYLRREGMDAIDGPINFGERDKFWGLLSRGWYPPLYQEYYHPTYYRAFFESRGYQPFEQVLSFYGSHRDFPIERQAVIAERLRDRHNITYRNLQVDQLPREAAIFSRVYNETFENFPYFKAIQPPQVEDMLKQMKPILDPRIINFAFDGDRPVGFTALIPEINQFLTHANGKLNLWTLPRFLWKLRTTRQQMVKGVAFGIHPDYQRIGVFAGLVDHLYYLDDQVNPKKYYAVVLATIRGQNAMMVRSMLGLGLKIQRVHIAYRKMLNPDLPFEPLRFTKVDDVPMGEVPGEEVYPTK